MINAPDSFEAADARFVVFLGKIGFPQRVAWLQKSDILWHKNQLLLKPNLRIASYADASKAYADGLKRGFGIWFYAFSKLKDATLATILTPQNKDEAERALVPGGGLKMSAAVRVIPARIASRFRWLILAPHLRKSSDLFWTDYFNLS